MNNSVGFHGVEGVKYCPRVNGQKGTTMIDVPFAQSIALNTVLSNTDRHADNRLVLQIPSDDGYEGTFGASARNDDLEKALGYMNETATGLLKTNVPYYSRGDFFYTFKAEFENAPAQVYKVWLLNVQCGKTAENASTDTNSITFGAYEYPLRVYGDDAVTSSGEAYLDSNGFRRVVTMMVSRPGDDGYDTFGNQVPSPVMAAVPTLTKATITGTAKVGETLSVTLTYSSDSPVPNLAYQWKSASTASGNFAKINGATGAIFTPSTSLVGKFIKVTVTASGQATGEATSEATTAVAAATA